LNPVEKERLFWSLIAKAAAHDMGTPLSAMMGWLELLPSLNDPASAIAEMQNSLKRLDVLSKRLESIGPPHRPDSCSLDEILEEAVAFFRRRIPPETSGIAFEKDTSGDLQAVCRRELIGWVLEILIKNAVDALPDHRGVITLRAFSAGDEAIVEVMDNGKGIPAEISDEIFNVGFGTKKSGRGIGLPLVKYIIEEIHGGSIGVQSNRKSGGTTVRIALRRPTS